MDPTYTAEQASRGADSDARIDAASAVKTLESLGAFRRDVDALRLAADPLVQSVGCGASAAGGALSTALRDRGTAAVSALAAVSRHAAGLAQSIARAAWADVAADADRWRDRFVVERIDRPVLAPAWHDYADRSYRPDGPLGEFAAGAPTEGFVSADVAAPAPVHTGLPDVRRVVMAVDVDGLRVLGARWNGLGRDLGSIASVLAAADQCYALAAWTSALSGQFVAMSGAVVAFAQGAGDAQREVLRLEAESDKAAPAVAHAPELLLVVHDTRAREAADLFTRHYVVALISASRQLPRFTGRPEGEGAAV